MTAKELLNFLLSLEDEGCDLSEIKVNYRTDEDSDVEACTFVGEDLFDEETNKVLTSIILMTSNNQ